VIEYAHMQQTCWWSNHSSILYPDLQTCNCNVTYCMRVTHQGSRIHLESIKMVDKFIVKWNSCTIGEWELDFLPSIKLAYNADDN